MNESSDEPPLPDRIRSWARTKAHAANFNPFGASDSQPPSATLGSTPSTDTATTAQSGQPSTSSNGSNDKSDAARLQNSEKDDVAGPSRSDTPPAAAPAADTSEKGEESSTINPQEKEKVPVLKRFLAEGKRILLYNVWINWLLVFVPIGIAFGAIEKAMGQDKSPISPTVVFCINAVAIIPLAGLLAFATESVASKMGDTIGALMNVTFGNAVELIIFIIALVAKEIRIVQASLLGSILANLLLILGMCFLFGGLRFREQLYNSTIGQMSACLLSLSVISLLLPTAFHYSFNNAAQAQADKVVVKISRGTSVVLLLVYVLYLLFQLKSHAYMYQSTPQHLIDEESHPGVLADMLNSSSSSDSSDSSSDTDSDSSSGSHNTAKRRFRRAFRRRRKSSASSTKETSSMPSMNRTPSSLTNGTMEEFAQTTSPMESTEIHHSGLEPVFSGDEADDDGEPRRPRRGTQNSFGITSRDFQTEPSAMSEKKRGRKHHKKNKRYKKSKKNDSDQVDPEKNEAVVDMEAGTEDAPRSLPRVGFVTPLDEEPAAHDAAKKPFGIRGLARPALPKVLSQHVFSQQPSQTLPPPITTQGSSSSQGGRLRRTSSLPDRLNRPTTQTRPSIMSKPSGPVPVSAQPLPHLVPPKKAETDEDDDEAPKHLSKTTAVMLLVISTTLVALCAEFLVDSIDYLVTSTGVSQAFIGLIVLPIVGNAAEHVTAVTVASKNKMDLAIGVALGSSIQIALFVTPIIVLLGWCLDTDMSLYFSLFETVSLFASAFIVNYLMIDGRSNYLEGALLIAAYVIIAVAAFFYPSCENQSLASGPTDGTGNC